MAIEGVGEAVTGAMLARQVEPETGEGQAHEAGNCLNCGAALAGDYCHVCGQKAHVHRTVSAWWHDFLHSVLHLDGKFWRTLPMLAWRPGELTRRYVEGERARFISPLALFLFSVFLMFAVFSMTGTSAVGVSDPAAANRDLTAEVDALRSEQARLEGQRRQLVEAGRDTRAIDARLADLRAELAAMDLATGFIESGPIEADTGWARLDQGIEKASENPALFFYKVQTNAYKFSWALIPISVPFLWLLFLHRRRYRAYSAYDHLVFVTYSIAFMSLALVAWFVLRSVGLTGAPIDLAILLVPPVHIFWQLRGAYRLSVPSALWRTFALVVLASIALTLFFLLLLALGALG